MLNLQMWIPKADLRDPQVKDTYHGELVSMQQFQGVDKHLETFARSRVAGAWRTASK